MMGSRRQSAATLGRIYPYRAAKQQAPGVAATDEKGFPNKPGMRSRSGMTDGSLFLEPAFKTGKGKDGEAGY